VKRLEDAACALGIAAIAALVAYCAVDALPHRHGACCSARGG